MDEAERRILNGTATSQEIVHFLRLGSSRERREQDILEKKRELMTAQTEAIESSKNIEELYAQAIKSMSRYAGCDDEPED